MTNPFETANNAATFLIYSTLVGGAVFAISKHDDISVLALIETNLDAFFLFIFIALFNLKTYFDDHKYFTEPYQADALWERGVGIVLAFLSWIFLAIAGAIIYRPESSAQLLGFAIGTSTAWIVVHIVEIIKHNERPPREQFTKLMREKWFAINLVYLLLIGLYINYPFSITAGPRWPYTLTMLFVLCYDMATSNMLRGVMSKRRVTQNQGKTR